MDFFILCRQQFYLYRKSFFLGEVGLNAFRDPDRLPVLNPSNFVPKNGFPVVKGLPNCYKLRNLTSREKKSCISIYVCVFFTLNCSSTRRHPAHPVSVLILHPRKISSVVTSYDTEIMHRNTFDNAMSCPSTGYDRHNIHTSATEIHWKREKYEINKNKNKNKIIIRKQIKTKIKIKHVPCNEVPSIEG